MGQDRNRVCPVGCAWGLEIGLRRWLQNPRKILAPYVSAGMTVLDIGCGTGFFSIEMARLVGPTGRVIAADLQEGMLEKVRQKTAGTELESRMVLHRCAADRLGVAGPVDFALAFYMVHEVPDPAGLFRELATLLRPGGKILIVEPAFHVTGSEFAATLEIARAAGFAAEHGPRLLLSRAAILKNLAP